MKVLTKTEYKCACVCVCQTGSLTGGFTAMSESTGPLERNSEHMFSMKTERMARNDRL